MQKTQNEAGDGDSANDSATEARALSVSLAELEAAVRAADPSTRLVVPRLLRRVVRQHAGLHGFGFRIPHGKSYVIDREPLLEIASREELGYGPTDAIPETVILLERPGFDELTGTCVDDLLLGCWRLLFHARIHMAMRERAAAGRLSPVDIRHRVERLGPIAFDEIRNVLRQERFLLPPYDDPTTYVEFVAVYLELRYFAPGLLPTYFPSIESLDEVNRLIEHDVEAEKVFLAARPWGAPDPSEAMQRAIAASTAPAWYESEMTETHPVRRDDGATPTRTAPSAGRHYSRHPSETKYRRWNARAERQAAAGNLAGAAIRRARAQFWAPPSRKSEAAMAVRNDIHRLVMRLQAAMAATDQDPTPWRDSLWALAHQTIRGIWTVEARLLYDLQKVCYDHERGIYAVGVVEWVLSLGRRPIKRPLPHQREVLMSKHLHSAARRVKAVRISPRHRRQLGELLRAATERAEQRLREHFRPLITRTLEESGLLADNLPERVAKKKLIEELLDRIIDRGFLTLGDLRDAISRNNLKQPDCDGPADFRSSDALLRADQRMATVLDGVYQRGEVYLRWIQWFSLLAFGTRTGRFLTLYLAVPFGGSYLALAGIDESVYILSGFRYKPELKTHTSVFCLGLLFVALLHVRPFRQGVWSAIKMAGTVLRFLLIDSVRAILRWPAVQRFLHSRPFTLAVRFLIKPLVPTIIIWRILPPEASRWDTSASIGAIFLALNLALNSRLGRDIEEAVVDQVVEGWHRFGLPILSGMFWWIMDLFRRILQTIERLLYSVDEWLRFKSGQSKLVLAAKAALGVVWFFVTYVVRFCVNLLIEPQVNPIKHFPVVTVSHKLIAPWSFTLFTFLATKMDRAVAFNVTAIIITGTPGIFGFLVWELKENWRLFAANRRKTLHPVTIGQHGEPMTRLLRSGFHSGTIPKRYAKLRRAQRHAIVDGESKAVQKHRDVLNRVELSLRRYVEREFVELFAQSGRWPGPPPSVGPIHLSTNQVAIAIELPGVSASPIWIAFDMLAGWMLAGVSRDNNTEELPPETQHILRTALVGLYKSGGAELIHQQITAAMPAPTPPYDMVDRGLAIWPDVLSDSMVVYDLHNGEHLVPQVLRGFPRHWPPTLTREKLVFADAQVTWDQWVAAWEASASGNAGQPSGELLPGQAIL